MSEIVRFGIVGTTAMVIHYGIYYVLLPYIDKNIAYTIGYVVSFLCNFLMSSRFTFRVKPTWRRLLRFSGSHGINYFISVALFNFFCWLGVPAKLAPLPVYAIAVPISFLLVRFALKKGEMRIGALLLLLSAGLTAQGQGTGIEDLTFVRRSFVRNYYNLRQPYAQINLRGTHLLEEHANNLVVNRLGGNVTLRQQYGKLMVEGSETGGECMIRCSDFNPFLCYEAGIASLPDSTEGTSSEMGICFYDTDGANRIVVYKRSDAVGVRFVDNGTCIDSLTVNDHHALPLTLRVQTTGARLHVFVQGSDCDTLLFSRRIPYCFMDGKSFWPRAVCRKWNFGLYARLGARQQAVADRIEAFFSSGTGQADPAIVQHKDGSPYIRDNRLFVALTTRGFEEIPDSHQGIYSIDVSTMEWRKEGTLLFERNGDGMLHPYHATKMVWDNDSQTWMLMTVSHGEDHRLLWATSKADLLHGYHVVDTHQLHEPYAQTGTDEDPDFLWDEQTRQWLLAYVSVVGKKGYQTVLCKSKQWNGGYKEMAVSEVGNTTGPRLLRTGRGLCVLSGGDDYHVLNFPDLKRRGGLKIIYPDGGFRGWASIAPVPEGDGTRYLWITFDRGRTLGRYSYGTLYHYLSIEHDTTQLP
ncbi:MAG: GtrA family protein [Prevotella sp.]|nr:GtrA family protein [Prevotella sp.]